MIQGKTKNNKYLVFHKGANKAPLHPHLYTLKYTHPPLFCSNIFFKKFLQIANFKNFFLFVILSINDLNVTVPIFFPFCTFLVLLLRELY
jgi:hypothetical protein